jgi:soluble lytic murein transglycosylase
MPAALAGIAAVAVHRPCLERIRRYIYDPLIARSAERHQVPPELLAAVIWRESGFDPYEIGRAGERGLMQVTAEAGREWAAACHVPGFSTADLLNPATNIEAGTWYLARAIARWSSKTDPVPYALAEYNAGRANARRWAGAGGTDDPGAFRERIDYPSTRAYVRDVLRRYQDHR